MNYFTDKNSTAADQTIIEIPAISVPMPDAPKLPKSPGSTDFSVFLMILLALVIRDWGNKK